MNLILSDVEETIMIVDQIEGAPEGHATVNVRNIALASWHPSYNMPPVRSRNAKWRCSSYEETVSSWYVAFRSYSI